MASRPRNHIPMILKGMNGMRDGLSGFVRCRRGRGPILLGIGPVDGRAGAFLEAVEEDARRRSPDQVRTAIIRAFRLLGCSVAGLRMPRAGISPR